LGRISTGIGEDDRTCGLIVLDIAFFDDAVSGDGKINCVAVVTLFCSVIEGIESLALMSKYSRAP